jgi:hypothetical protein
LSAAIEGLEYKANDLVQQIGAQRQLEMLSKSIGEGTDILRYDLTKKMAPEYVTDGFLKLAEYNAHILATEMQSESEREQNGYENKLDDARDALINALRQCSQCGDSAALGEFGSRPLCVRVWACVIKLDGPLFRDIVSLQTRGGAGTGKTRESIFEKTTMKFILEEIRYEEDDDEAMNKFILSGPDDSLLIDAIKLTKGQESPSKYRDAASALDIDMIIRGCVSFALS